MRCKRAVPVNIVSSTHIENNGQAGGARASAPGLKLCLPLWVYAGHVALQKVQISVLSRFKTLRTQDLPQAQDFSSAMFGGYMLPTAQETSQNN